MKKSVFECPELTEKQFLKRKARLKGLIDSAEDSVRYYRQCKGCLEQCEVTGIGVLPEAKDYRVV